MRFVPPLSRQPAPARRGQTLVEFAIILPFLLLIFSAIVDFGFLFYDHVSTQAACREGGRCMIQADNNNNQIYSDDQIKSIVRKSHGPFNPISSTPVDEITMTHYIDASGAEFGTTGPPKHVRTIMISHTHYWIIPVFIPFLPSIQIKSFVKAYTVAGLTRL